VSLPADLVPLPTAPYDERPETIPLEIEECRTALWLTKGNITEAAKLLKVPSARLRRFVRNSAYLTEEWNESREMLADKAQEIVEEALFDEDPSRRDTMARFVLQSIGRHRGFGTSGGVNVNVNKGGKISISWGDGTAIGPNKPDDEPPTIEGEVSTA